MSGRAHKKGEITMMNNTNTMNTKNYAIVANNGLSILMNQEGQYKVYTANNNLLASLKALQVLYVISL